MYVIWMNMTDGGRLQHERADFADAVRLLCSLALQPNCRIAMIVEPETETLVAEICVDPALRGTMVKEDEDDDGKGEAEGDTPVEG